MSIRITLTPTSHSVDFEVGSPSEGIGFIEENGAAMTRLLEVLDRLPKSEGAEVAEGAAPVTAEPAKRGRKPRNAGGDPATATAPPPIAVPALVPAAPVAPTPPAAPAAPAGTDGFAIPAFLDRTNPPPPAAPPPAPAAPPAPPPAPPAPPPAPPAPPVAALPPSGVLAERIISALEARKVTSPDAPKQLADWLASCKLVIPGVSYDEAIAVLRMQPDEKLQILLAPLGL